MKSKGAQQLSILLLIQRCSVLLIIAFRGIFFSAKLYRIENAQRILLEVLTGAVGLGKVQPRERCEYFDDATKTWIRTVLCRAKKMPGSYAKVIVNPVAGSLSVGREWPRIYRQLREAGLSFDYELTKYAGHAMEIARRSADDGYYCLIAVGGDGTVNEVANGILRSTRSGNTILGIAGMGTAHAFALSLGIGEDSTSAFSLLTGQGRALIDVGVIQCWSQGQSIKRFFVNEASVGFSAEIVDAWKYLPTRFGHSLNLALRTLTGYTFLTTHRNQRLSLHVGNEVESICCCGVVVANGRYFADGMQIAPHASLDDGLLDVVIIGDVTKGELLKIRPMLYDGSHIKHAKIREKKTTTITIESDEQLLVEADGDIIGEGPASFRVMPSALTIIV
ncbi:diacylglycerol/lipid kinase family protein [Chloroflexota bacterium]